jgi:hypothetical protein
MNFHIYFIPIIHLIKPKNQLILPDNMHKPNDLKVKTL